MTVWDLRLLAPHTRLTRSPGDSRVPAITLAGRARELRDRLRQTVA